LAWLEMTRKDRERDPPYPIRDALGPRPTGRQTVRTVVPQDGRRRRNECMSDHENVIHVMAVVGMDGSVRVGRLPFQSGQAVGLTIQLLESDPGTP